jgi:hypothetical protein
LTVSPALGGIGMTWETWTRWPHLSANVEVENTVWVVAFVHMRHDPQGIWTTVQDRL